MSLPACSPLCRRAVERGGQFVLLGSAPDPKVQADFDALASSMGGQVRKGEAAWDDKRGEATQCGCVGLVPTICAPLRVRLSEYPASCPCLQDAAFCFKYDEPLSHLIYAAADMVVVPSMFEPCGLTQVCISMCPLPAAAPLRSAADGCPCALTHSAE